MAGYQSHELINRYRGEEKKRERQTDKKRQKDNKKQNKEQRNEKETEIIQRQEIRVGVGKI